MMKRLVSFLLLLILTIGFIFPRASIAIQEVYLALDDHTDYLWTATDVEYQHVFQDMLDYYMNLAQSTSNEPFMHQSKFNTDGSYWIWEYEKNRNSTDFTRLVNYIRSGHIAVPLNPLVVMFGSSPAEGVLRGMYYAGSLERRFNLQLPVAISMENQTLPLGLGSLWSGAGAQYSWKGVCGCDTLIAGNLGNRDHEMYMWQGLDGKRILMKWYSMPGDNMHLGGYAEARFPSQIVDYVNGSAFKQDYGFDIVGAFGKGWDDLETYTNEFVTTAKSKTNASRTVYVSNIQDFFQDFEATYVNQLPTVTETYGNEWELYAAALAEQSGVVKRMVERLRGAEFASTLVNLVDTNFMNQFASAKEKAFINMSLFWEHNFGMVATAIPYQTRINWQKKLANEISSYVTSLESQSLSRLGTYIAKSGTNQRFFALNQLSWNRSDMAEYVYTGSASINVVDVSTNLAVPHQIVTRDGVTYLQIFAENVPAYGYKVFEIRSGAGQTFPTLSTTTVSSSSVVVDHPEYKVTINPNGSIKSIVDKSNGDREVVATINSRTVNDLGSSTGTMTVESNGPVSTTILVTASSPLQHRSRITLVKDQQKIFIENHIDQNFEATNTWKYSFNLSNPTTRHEEVGAIITAKLKTNGGHYATKNARYDWQTLNHFVDMSEGSYGVTLSNSDTLFMKLGNSSVSTLDSTTPQISVLVGGKIANGTLGLPNQGGDTHFLQRFALTTHIAYDQTNAMKFALEQQNPFLTATVVGGTNNYPENQFQLLAISDPNVLGWAVKPSESGINSGITVRAWNVANSAKTAAVTFLNRNIAQAYKTTHLENRPQAISVANNSVSVPFSTQDMQTFLIKTSTGPVATPTPIPSPSVSPSPTLSPIPTPTVSPVPTRSPSPSPTLLPSPTPTHSPTPTPTPVPTPTASPLPSGQVTYSFSDVLGSGVAVDGVHSGINFGTGNWLKDQSYAGLTDTGYFSVPGVTSRTFTLPQGKVLKSIKVTGNEGGTYQISSAGNPTLSGSIVNNTPSTVTTNWSASSVTVTIFFSSGWAASIDDIVYADASTVTATPTPSPTVIPTPTPTPSPTKVPTPTPSPNVIPTPSATATPIPSSTPAPSQPSSDVNHDGNVTVSDMLLIIQSWFSSGACQSFNCDIDNNGKVNVLDFGWSVFQY